MNVNLLKMVMVALAGVLLVSASSCGGTPPTSVQNNDPWAISDIQVKEATPTKAIVKTEDFPLPNCEGTGPLKMSLATQASVEKAIAVGAKAKTSAGVEVGLPATVKAKLEAEVEGAYQQTYKEAIAYLYTIIMEADKGTSVVYVVNWEEQKFDSSIGFVNKAELLQTPYTYTLRVPKISKSRRESCPSQITPTNTPTPTPTATPTPISTSTPPPIIVGNSRGAEQILVLDGTETAALLWIENASPYNPFICQSGNCTYLLRVDDRKWKMYDKNDFTGKHCPPTVPDVPEGGFRPVGDFEIVWCMLEGWKDLGWGEQDIQQRQWTYMLYPDRLVLLDAKTGNSYALNQDKTWQHETAK